MLRDPDPLGEDHGGDHGRHPDVEGSRQHGMGVDNIAVDHATEKGILVVNAPFSNLNAVAEHIVMLLLALSKRTVQMDQADPGRPVPKSATPTRPSS